MTFAPPTRFAAAVASRNWAIRRFVLEIEMEAIFLVLKLLFAAGDIGSAADKLGPPAVEQPVDEKARKEQSSNNAQRD